MNAEYGIQQTPVSQKKIEKQNKNKSGDRKRTLSNTKSPTLKKRKDRGNSITKRE